MSDTPERQRFIDFANNFPHEWLTNKDVLPGVGTSQKYRVYNDDRTQAWDFKLIADSLGLPGVRYWHRVEIREEEVPDDPNAITSFPTRAIILIPRGRRDMSHSGLRDFLITAYDEKEFAANAAGFHSTALRWSARNVVATLQTTNIDLYPNVQLYSHELNVSDSNGKRTIRLESFPDHPFTDIPATMACYVTNERYYDSV
ncbi:hypothetical protein GLAREA_05697 [Glarea lozoyensis ATCC 20868]|uniref:Uncharacterized protein n=1 Tax=Glarea lozoyensis (strain ATCC 20868 / MF5171) TaxID=1116229 RepID=S3DGV8_GLAL2|nr:uncharacterized protein GLAREA_05697 [Glarea lozoyensis ATCC 20868]EPE36359.1 hypothetical protein GLAREA_05697 [Glarea lozoyensis ATCC 20868]